MSIVDLAGSERYRNTLNSGKLSSKIPKSYYVLIFYSYFLFRTKTQGSWEYQQVTHGSWSMYGNTTIKSTQGIHGKGIIEYLYLGVF